MIVAARFIFFLSITFYKNEKATSPVAMIEIQKRYQ